MDKVHVVRRCGYVLYFAFIVVIVSVVFPLDFSSSDWGRRLSTLTVDACSLSLVGLGLLRYANYLENGPKQSPILAGSIADPDAGVTSEVVDPEQEPPGSNIRILAYLSYISLVLLAIWQVFLLFGSWNQNELSVFYQTRQITVQYEAIEKQISQAPPEAIEQAWRQSQGTGKQDLIGESKSIAAKRLSLVEKLNIKKQELLKTASEKINSNKYSLMLASVRVILLALIYAWGFNGLSRK